MSIDFKNSPAVGDKQTLSNGTQWQWDGAKWAGNTPTTSGGPFLPLAGGTVTGALNVSAGGVNAIFDQNVSSQGGELFGYNISSGNLSGARTGGYWQMSLVQVPSDTMDAGGGGFCAQLISLHSGGGNTSGNRLGQYIDTYFSGSTLDASRGYPSQYGGQWIYAHASGNNGGTSLGASRGALWGGLASATLQSGATFWSYCLGMEINVGVSSGASAAFVQGLKIAVQNHAQAHSNTNDALFGMAKVALSDAQFANGIVFGMVDGYWPIDASGTLIGSQASVLATPPPRTATNGVDFSAVTFSGAAFKSNNFTVDGTGHVKGSGLECDQVFASGPNDITKHLNIYGGQAGICATSDTNLNYNNVGTHVFYINNTLVGYISATGLNGCVIGQNQAMNGTFSHVAASSGASFGSATVTATDLSKHLDLYGGQYGVNVVSTSGGALNLVSGNQIQMTCGGAEIAAVGSNGISASQLSVGGATFAGPTWTTGSAAPAATAPVGSLYSRVGGAVGATLYVSRGGGTWNAVAGV